jgi:hypothetical protein
VGAAACNVVSWRSQTREDVIFPLGLEKRTSATEAVKDRLFNGTAEAVPFVEQSLPWALRSPKVTCCRNWPGENPITGAKAQVFVDLLRPD